MRFRRPSLGRLAAVMIAASVGIGLLTIGARLVSGGSGFVRALEAATLVLAAGAYLAYALAHHKNRRELMTRAILVSAFALWAIVQAFPGDSASATLNDVVILLFVADLAILLSPWR
jgi:hypothetical protein